MNPVRTARSNVIYRGPSPEVGDAWTESTREAAYLTWEPTDEERAAIAGGALLRLGVFQHPMPPVSLEVSTESKLTPEGARWHERARKLLRGLARTPFDIPAGYWLISEDVWTDLQASGALDVSGVPTLCGRPLMRGEELPADTLSFEQPGQPEAK